MKMEMLKTVRRVIHADSDPVHQSLFEHLRASQPLIRAAWRCHRLLGRSPFSTLLLFGFGAGSYLAATPSTSERNRPLIVAIYANARKQARQVVSWMGWHSVAWLETGSRRMLTAGAMHRFLRGALHCRAWRRYYRVVRRLTRGLDFFVGCRVASAVFCYVRATEILSDIQSLGVIVSSDSHPEPLAFAQAATGLGIPTIFIAHAHPTAVSSPLDYTLAILEGEAARQCYEELGPVRGRVVYCGSEGESRPLRAEQLSKTKPTIGIFAPKVVRWPRLGELIADCQRLFAPARILIRWHPSMLGPSRLSATLADTNNVRQTPSGLRLQEVAQQCDWVIADENSHVHLGVLKAGVPTVPIRDFSVLPASRADLYGFVGSRIIPPPVASVREVSLEVLRAFYAHDWAERFRRFDAGYLSPPGRLTGEVREAILRVLAGRDPPRPSW